MEQEAGGYYVTGLGTMFVNKYGGVIADDGLARCGSTWDDHMFWGWYDTNDNVGPNYSCNGEGDGKYLVGTGCGYHEPTYRYNLMFFGGNAYVGPKPADCVEVQPLESGYYTIYPV